MTRFVAAATAFVLVASQVRISAAQDEVSIAKGVELYDDLEYEQAIEMLTAALGRLDVTVEDRTRAYEHIALSNLALGKDDQARAAFRALLKENPDHTLPTTMSQKARDMFEEVRQSLPKPRPAAAPVRLTQTASPAAPAAGSAVTVTVAVADTLGRVSRVVVYHRVRGAQSYSTIDALKTGEGRYTATVSGLFVSAPGVEYYVAALDESGASLAAEGAPSAPMLLAIAHDGAPAGAPIYKKWWFWAGVGGVIVTGIVVGIALAGDGGGDSNDATVVITVE